MAQHLGVPSVNLPLQGINNGKEGSIQAKDSTHPLLFLKTTIQREIPISGRG